jgi:hypothetical protein
VVEDQKDDLDEVKGGNMLEIFIMIGVIAWFARTASSLGKSGFLWGFIGAISYYGPVVVFGRFIYPEMVRGVVTYENQGLLTVGGVALSVAVGAGCCFIARQILLAAENAQMIKESASRKPLEGKVLLSSLEAPEHLVGKIAYDSGTGHYLGRIVSVTKENGVCLIKSDFGNEMGRDLSQVLVKALSVST